MTKKAFITGISGQDGSLLADYLLGMGYEVSGTIRSASSAENINIEHLKDSVKTIELDLSNDEILAGVLSENVYDEIYHLAAVTFVPDSKDNLLEVLKINTESLRTILNYVDTQKLKTKVFYASSVEAVGPFEGEVDETTACAPSSPYGLSKLMGQELIKFFQRRGVYCCYGVLFNHESLRRGERFVTRKITKGVAAIKNGEQDKLVLGNIEAFRDWGSAHDFVEAFHLMLQQETPKNYVIGTGEAHSVKEVLELLFNEVGLDYKNYVEISQDFYREESLTPRVANYSKIKRDLGWTPKKDFQEIFFEMLEYDLN